MAAPALVVHGLKVYYHTSRGPFRVVDGVQLELEQDEILGIAGESGCGKSTVVEGILRLVAPPGRIEAGRVLLYGNRAEAVDVLSLAEEAMRRIRWTRLAYVPQGSMNSLNPVLRVREQMLDAMLDHGARSRSECLDRIPILLRAVGLTPSTAEMHPHQLSGGMRQRVVIANSISLNPEVVVADEPTTGLDVHAQRQVLETLLRVRREHRVAMIFVSHDLAVHAQLVDRLVVMYAGQVMEIGPVVPMFRDPRHPYSLGLVASMVRIGGPRRRLFGIPGLAPSPLEWPGGCRFHPRCPYAFDRCREVVPVLQPLEPGRWAACHLYAEGLTDRLAQARREMLAGPAATGARLQEVHAVDQHAAGGEYGE